MRNYFNIKKFFKNIDFVVFFLALAISSIGLSIIYSFGVDNGLFLKQIISLGIAVSVFFIVSSFDISFLKNSNFIFLVYFFCVGLLALLLVTGTAISGAQSWFDLGFFSFQPTDLAKFILVLLLAKYFFRRHIVISRFRHIFISGFYTLIFFVLLALQPDLGSAMIIFFIWFGFVMVSGIPKKYIIGLLVSGTILSSVFYNFVLEDYQKKRIDTFLNPGIDPLGSGYNIIQANIALGSGQMFGKGVSNGTQFRLGFLPEAETDFIFSAYAEEWGFAGVLVLFLMFSVLLLRLIIVSSKGHSNFESLLGAGIVIYFSTHFFVHVGINLGFLPVTGTTMPFMSYGGSHLLIEYFALGILNAISKTARDFHKVDLEDKYIIG
ncbi:MAG: rod shape-determining protein RodA [Candidatus Pacebacteria bacterium]|nr:rod shape-determining protein RodA [Candidatus Paceibacterota bacterium]